jgi:hypothetical protein
MFLRQICFVAFFSFCVNPILLYFPELKKAVLGERSVYMIVATKSLENLKIRYGETAGIEE